MSEQTEAFEPQEELAPTSSETQAEQDEKRSVQFGLFDSLLGASLVMVLIAIVLLFIELRGFGKFPSVFPWRTSEVLESTE